MNSTGNRARGKTACYPKFSPEDGDLETMCWRTDSDGYARATVNYLVLGGRKATCVFAHRIVAARIAGREIVPDEIVDHKDFDRLNCRRNNLRLTTKYGNAQHRNIPKNRGVTFDRRTKKWQASVQHKGKDYYCGQYVTPEEAALAAASKRKELGFLTHDPVAE